VVCSLFVVWSGNFDFWEKGRPVMVTVKALGVKKPDQTRLSNTTHPHPPPHALLSACTYPIPRQEENEHHDTVPNILLRYVCRPFLLCLPQTLFTTDHGIHNPAPP